ncbi:MAG: alpha/beta hydrolase, partial [Spirochaetota bacterium]|nr:alpha/beta hydrolase [Spirochaetota bacterium]
GFRVIAIDLYGHGKSSKLEKITLDTWSDQINDLMYYLKISKVIIIGVSMGGVIAQHFLIKYNSKVIKLIIADSFGELKTLKEKMLGVSQVIGFGIFKLFGVKTFAKAMRFAYKAVLGFI